MKKDQETPVLSLLGRMIAYRPWLYLANLLLWVGTHNIAVISELAGRGFYDLLEGRESGWPIQQVLIISATGYILRVIFLMAGSLTDAEHRFVMRSLLQRNLLRLIYRHPGAELIPGQSGEAVATIKTENDTLADIISWSIDTAGELLALVIALYLLLRIDSLLTLLVYLSLIFVVFISTRLEKVVQNAREQAQEAGAKIGDRIGDIFASIQAVQVAGAEEPVLEHLRELYATRRKYVLRERVYNILLDGMFYLNFTLITAVILYFSASRLLLGSMSVGDLSLFINYLDMLTDSTLFIGIMLFKYVQSKVAFRRYGALAQTDDLHLLVEHSSEPGRGEALRPEVGYTPQTTDLTNLSVRGLSYRYAQSGKGIEGVDLDLPQGSFTVITGRIGSGKTTLLRGLLGLVTPASGSVNWNEVPVTNPMDFFVPPRSAYVPQLPTLLSTSLTENIALGEPFSEAEIRSALETVAFGPDLVTLEQGLETRIGNRGMKLSGGQMQRVATARALVRQAELLVFDDLSSALDVRTEQTLWQNLQQQHATFLVVSHRRAAFLRADQIIVLEDGRVSAKGTWQELLQSSEIFRGLWDQGSSVDN